MLGFRSNHQHCLTRNTGASRVLALTAVLIVTAGRPILADPAPAIPAAAAAQQPVLSSLLKQAPGLRPEVLKMAVTALAKAANRGLVQRQDLLTVIDYTIPSTQPRLFTFDLSSQRLVFLERVAHGKNSGDNATTRFSNSPGSLESSLGLFVTGGTYFGANGLSMRLRGLEPGFNDTAWDRMIVMHGASYVSDTITRVLGRLGRSWGCPAVRKEIAPKMIDKLKNGTVIFAYYPDSEWLKKSSFLN